MPYAVLLAVTIVTSATLVVLGVLAILAGALRPRPRGDTPLSLPESEAVFIFRDEVLIDCSDKARHLLDTLPADPDAARPDDALDRLLRYLAAHFPDISTDLAQLAGKGALTLVAEGDSGMTLSARFHKGLTRIHLSDTRAEGALVALDRLSFEALKSEVETLRKVARHVPALVWQTDRASKVVWANAGYIARLQSADPGVVLTWPLPALFERSRMQGPDRLALEVGGQTSWFSYARIALGARDMHIATPIDSAVQSEAARQETLQTLTRTFASLQIGLALFDAERRLQVFNPALVDMTGLEPLFLAARPSFEQVLYALREARMLPEPKDFNNWRREIIEMEKAAESGAYSQEWCLEGGRTFHVTGRPQPNGAIALFIEDVTTEAALSRSFRSEIETVHKVLDGLSDGIIAFSLAGQTLLANDAYTRLWQADPCTDLADEGLAQAIRLWSGQAEPTTFWARLAEFASAPSGGGATARLSATIVLRDGAMLGITARRLTGGTLMIVFQQVGLRAAQPGRVPAAELALQSELVQSPDLSRATGGAPALALLAPASSEERSRKTRSARHAGSRVRV